MLLLPFLFLFRMMAQTDGTWLALKSLAISLFVVGWIAFGAWLLIS